MPLECVSTQRSALLPPRVRFQPSCRLAQISNLNSSAEEDRGAAPLCGTSGIGDPWVGADWEDGGSRKEECLRNGSERRQSWAFRIFSRPPKRLWTRNLAGALHTEVVRCKLSVGREIKTEIIVLTLFLIRTCQCPTPCPPNPLLHSTLTESTRSWANGRSAFSISRSPIPFLA
jgi:hypothetical protein